MSKYIYADNIYDKDPWKTWKNISIDGKNMDTDYANNSSTSTKNSKNIEIISALKVLPRTNVTPTSVDLDRVIIHHIN